MTTPVPGARERLRPVARSIFGLLAGFCLILLLWFAAYLTLLFVAPRSFDVHGNPTGGGGTIALVLVTAACSYVGGVVGTRLARRAPVVHAALLAAMQGGTLVTWVRDFGAGAPSWFGISLVGLSVVAILVGGIGIARRRTGLRAPVADRRQP